MTTLGMGVDEMNEIADLIHSVLLKTKSNTISKGKKAGQRSLAKYSLDALARDSAQSRVADLLARFPLYPEIDL